MSNEEIYDDGSSISNQTVSGVRNMRTMFETVKKDHPLNRNFSSRPGHLPPPAEVTPKAKVDTPNKVHVLPMKMEKPHLKPTPKPSPKPDSAGRVMSPPVALKPRTAKPGEAAEVNNNDPKDFRSVLKKTGRFPGSPKSPQPVTLDIADKDSKSSPAEAREKDGEIEKDGDLQRRTPRGWKGEAVRRSIITRHHDNKRFRRASPPASLPSEAPPSKPPALPNVDLSNLLQEYAAELARCGATENGEMEEIYDDVGGPGDRPVSILPEMTEEEELGEEPTTPAPVAPPDEGLVYDDALAAPSGGADEDEEDGEMYEALDEIQQQQQDSGGSADTASLKSEKEKNEKELARLKKQEEKERKEKEKREREEKRRKEQEDKRKQAELRRKEKEEKEMRAKFKLTGEIEHQCEGVIKKDAKGRGLDLAVHAGEKVGIVRINGNPKGKWLVQNQEGKLGHVDSSNVEMMNTVAASVDGTSGSPASNEPAAGDDGEVYEGVDEDIYEECA